MLFYLLVNICFDVLLILKTSVNLNIRIIFFKSVQKMYTKYYHRHLLRVLKLYTMTKIFIFSTMESTIVLKVLIQRNYYFIWD